MGENVAKTKNLPASGLSTSSSSSSSPTTATTFTNASTLLTITSPSLSSTPSTPNYHHHHQQQQQQWLPRRAHFPSAVAPQLVILFVLATATMFLFTSNMTTISSSTFYFSNKKGRNQQQQQQQYSHSQSYTQSKIQTRSLLHFLIPQPRPLTLRIPKFNSSSSPNNVTVQLESLLSSVNGTLLSNPNTTKPYILYRAIGNDLPPRHKHGQAYDNVRFMLEHEQSYDDLDVRWYINRIFNQSELIRIVRLLISYNQTFTIDPFDFDQFMNNHQANVDVNLYGFKPIDVLRANFFYRNDSLSGHARREIRDKIFAPLNHFIVHNNHARNNMIQLGLNTNARYILPWDGNCFLTKTAWKNISSAIHYIDTEYFNSTTSTSTTNNNNKTKKHYLSSSLLRYTSRYFYVPMVRITDNLQLLNSSYIPDSIDEEPQLIFRRDATQRFNESLPYGCRPKVQLLWRLRVPGWWHKRHMHPSSCMSYDRALQKSVDVPLNMRIPIAGWVARLFSGVAHLEVDGAIALRGGSRSDAIEAAAARATMTVLQEKKGLFKHSVLLYNQNGLSKMLHRYAFGDKQVTKIVARLFKTADQIKLDEMNVSRQLVDFDFSKNKMDDVDNSVDSADSSSRFNMSDIIRKEQEQQLEEKERRITGKRRRRRIDDNDIITTITRPSVPDRLKSARKLAILTLAALFSGDSQRLRLAIDSAMLFFSTLSPFDSRLSNEGGIDLCVALDAVNLLYLSSAPKSLSSSIFNLIEQTQNWTAVRSWVLVNSTLSVDDFYGATWRSVAHDIHGTCVNLHAGDGVAVARHSNLVRGRILSQFRNSASLWRDGIRGLTCWTLMAEMSKQTTTKNSGIYDFLYKNESNVEEHGTPFLINATRAIVHTSWKSSQERKRRGIEIGEWGSDEGREELCATTAVAMIVETSVGYENVWKQKKSGNVTDNDDDDERPQGMPIESLSADECVEDDYNIVPPFWNLAVDDREEEGQESTD